MQKDYYRVRCWIKESGTHKIEGENFDSFEKAKNSYTSIKPDEVILQVELLKEEHDHNGELIYEDLLRIKDKESEKVWK